MMTIEIPKILLYAWFSFWTVVYTYMICSGIKAWIDKRNKK